MVHKASLVGPASIHVRDVRRFVEPAELCRTSSYMSTDHIDDATHAASVPGTQG